jgi:hypothetical protein
MQDELMQIREVLIPAAQVCFIERLGLPYDGENYHGFLRFLRRLAA